MNIAIGMNVCRTSQLGMLPDASWAAQCADEIPPPSEAHEPVKRIADLDSAVATLLMESENAHLCLHKEEDSPRRSTWRRRILPTKVWYQSLEDDEPSELDETATKASSIDEAKSPLTPSRKASFMDDGVEEEDTCLAPVHRDHGSCFEVVEEMDDNPISGLPANLELLLSTYYKHADHCGEENCNVDAHFPLDAVRSVGECREDADMVDGCLILQAANDSDSDHKLSFDDDALTLEIEGTLATGDRFDGVSCRKDTYLKELPSSWSTREDVVYTGIVEANSPPELDSRCTFPIAEGHSEGAETTLDDPTFRIPRVLTGDLPSNWSNIKEVHDGAVKMNGPLPLESLFASPLAEDCLADIEPRIGSPSDRVHANEELSPAWSDGEKTVDDGLCLRDLISRRRDVPAVRTPTGMNCSPVRSRTPPARVFSPVRCDFPEDVVDTGHVGIETPPSLQIMDTASGNQRSLSPSPRPSDAEQCLSDLDMEHFVSAASGNQRSLSPSPHPSVAEECRSELDMEHFVNAASGNQRSLSPSRRPSVGEECLSDLDMENFVSDDFSQIHTLPVSEIASAVPGDRGGPLPSSGASTAEKIRDEMSANTSMVVEADNELNPEQFTLALPIAASSGVLVDLDSADTPKEYDVLSSPVLESQHAVPAALEVDDSQCSIADILAALSGSDEPCCITALRSLAGIDHAEHSSEPLWAEVVMAAFTCMERDAVHIRKTAFQVSHMMSPHSPSLVTNLKQWLGSEDGSVQNMAVDLLLELDPSNVSEPLSPLSRTASDEASALDTASKPEQASLGLASFVLEATLSWASMHTGDERIDSLCVLAAKVLQGHTSLSVARSSALIVSCFECFDSRVREAAVEAISRLTSEQIGANALNLSIRLRDEESNVRLAALHAFSLMDPSVLKEWISSVSSRLRDSRSAVRLLATKVLGMLDREELLLHDSSFRTQIGNDNTLFHLAAEHGYLQALQSLGTRHRRHFLHAQNADGDTALHVAARAGRLTACQTLVRLGSLVKIRNKQGHTAAQVAEEAGCVMVAHYLVANESVAIVRGAAGDVISLAMCDMRPVVGVEWYTIALPGVAGAAGAVHSFLAVTVGTCCDESNFCDTYVIEKAASVQTSSKQQQRCENGVYVSRWCEVMPNVLSKPLHSLDRSDITNNTNKAFLCVRTLRELAVNLGPYNAATCNCHHAAQVVYNACARPDAQVQETPNQDLMVVPRILNAIGLDIGLSGLASSLAIAR